MYIDNMEIFAMNRKKLKSRIQTITMLSEDTGMEFGTEKYAINIIKKKGEKNQRKKWN